MRGFDLDERAPAGFLRLVEQPHAGLLGGAVAFTAVTGDTGANDIDPGGLTAAVAGDDVVEVEILAFKSFAAILAGVLVSFEDVLAGKFYVFFGKLVEGL